MEKKKILIVSRSFYPMNTPRSFRTTELVKEFARQGHDVTLYTVKNSEHHKPFEKEHGVTIRNLGGPSLKTLPTEGGRIKNLFGRAVNRGLNLLFEYPNIELMWRVKKAMENESGYDLLISIATPHPTHWGVSFAWNRNKNLAETWVADCGDPYMGNTMDSFNNLFYFKFFEKAFCRKADYISVPVREAKKGYFEEFHHKIKVIPQGFNFNEVQIDAGEYSPNPVPTFAYAGGLIPGGRDPGPYLDYLAGLDKKYKCIFYTRSTEMVQPYVDKSGGKIEIRDYIPREELLRVLSRMDFLINVENRADRMVPSKLIDYHMAGRPVLSVKSGEVDTELTDQFLEGNYSGRFQFDDPDQYRIENVCNKFLELCEVE